jgi:hypothetical protein
MAACCSLFLQSFLCYLPSLTFPFYISHQINTANTSGHRLFLRQRSWASRSAKPYTTSTNKPSNNHYTDTMAPPPSDLEDSILRKLPLELRHMVYSACFENADKLVRVNQSTLQLSVSNDPANRRTSKNRLAAGRSDGNHLQKPIHRHSQHPEDLAEPAAHRFIGGSDQQDPRPCQVSEADLRAST